MGGGTFVSDADLRPWISERECRELANFTNEFRRNSRYSLIREIRVDDRHLLFNHYRKMKPSQSEVSPKGFVK
jgi:hypothetical protein